MFFTLGVINIVIGLVILAVQNNELPRQFRVVSRWDYVGALVMFSGLIALLYSLLSLAWRYLP